MTVKTYELRKFANPFEEEVFKQLKSALEKSPEEYLLFGPVRIDRRELDGLIISDGYMVALEVKAVRGHVSMSANIPVTVRAEDGDIIDFQDRHEDPYDQAEKHWRELSTFIRNAFGDTGFWFKSMLVFEPGSTFDVPSEMRDALSPNSLVVALDEVPGYLAHLSNRYNKTGLTRDQQETLVKAVTHGPAKLTGTEKKLFASSTTPAREVPRSYPSTPLEPKISPPVPKRVTPPAGRGDKPPPPPKPWYRSTWFLGFAFLFLNPVWAFLMLKDQERGWFVKLVATVFLLVQLLACLGVVYLVQMDPGIIGFPRAAPAPSGTPSSDLPTRPNMPEPTSAPSVQAETSPDTEDACTIIWVETGSESLANKNRAMVWEQTIRARVAGSGMTDRQFYDQVVERNPVLKADGYVFLEGKTYYLPQCE